MKTARILLTALALGAATSPALAAGAASGLLLASLLTGWHGYEQARDGRDAARAAAQAAGQSLQQRQQATALLIRMAVIVDPVGGHTLFGQFPGDGATEQGILFEQQYRHARTSFEQTIEWIMVEPRRT